MLATAIAGVGTAGPVLAQRQIQPPPVPPNVMLSCPASRADVEMAAYVVDEVEKASRAAHAVAADVSPTAVAQVVRTVIAVRPQHATGAGAHRQESSTVISRSAAPNLAQILGVPLLAATLALDVVANSAEAISDASFGIGNILAGVAVEDPMQIQLGVDELREIPGDFGHLIFNVETHIRQIAAAFGLGPDVVAVKPSMAPRAFRATVGVDAPMSIRDGSLQHRATRVDSTEDDTSIGELERSKSRAHSRSTSSAAKPNRASSTDTGPEVSSADSGRTPAPSARRGVPGVRHSAMSGPKKRSGGAQQTGQDPTGRRRAPANHEH
jgi:hypothetical protein